jgi:hypothetical protein
VIPPELVREILSGPADIGLWIKQLVVVSLKPHEMGGPRLELTDTDGIGPPVVTMNGEGSMAALNSADG